MEIDISSDIAAAMKDVHGFFWSEVPYATSVALNNTAFDVRKVIVNVTYPKAFTVRNRVFPARLFKVVQKAKKGHLEAIVGETLDREYFEVHAEGGMRPTRGRVAIPVAPESVRAPTGRVRRDKKPRNLKNAITVDRKGKTLIFQRKKKDLELVYVIAQDAKLQKTFRFESDSLKTTFRVFPGHWATAMDRAIRTSRFEQS